MDVKKVAATAKGKTAKVGKADMALNFTGKLYGIKKRLKGLIEIERHEVRQRESVPILKRLRQWLNKRLHRAMPKGLLGKALGYLGKQWYKLTIYTENGYLNIDNSPAENAICPFVIGRKNWLFSGTQEGAKGSAVLSSIIEIAKANGLEPFEYLSRIFKELPQAQSLEDVEVLLPWKVSSESLPILSTEE